MRVAVLGTGPTSIQALNTLLHESKNPSIFQISIYDFSFGPENTEVYQQPSLKKLNSNYALSVPIELQLQRAKVSQIWGSFARGGWSNIWGAAIYEHPDDNHQNVDLSKLPSALKGFYLARHEARRIPNFLDQTYEYHSECADSECSLRLEISSLAIRPIHEDAQFGCIQCAECLDGCRFGHIWNSEQVLNNLCREFNLNIEQGFVKYVKFERNSITITKESESEFSTKCHDLVICGLGAVQTAALLLRSKICPMSVLVRDSQMLTVPFMMRNRAQTGTFEARIALSEAVISGKLDVSGASGDFFSQLYGYSKSLDEVFLTKLPILRFVMWPQN
ncbi:MAG: hypothetical protein EBU69_02255 [Methylophilaceae bacterium]|nr:hypothetical protein [Methylophilaceae bacterium]